MTNKEMVEEIVKRYFETGDMSKALGYLKELVRRRGNER